MAMPNDILIVCALESETCGLFTDMPVLYTGVGKVNAASNLMRGIFEWRQERGKNPGLILNMGSAGSPIFKAGTIVNCTSFIERDMDVTALGFAPYQTPFDLTPVPLIYGARYAEYTDACCGTGDHFVDDASDHPWQVVDMEVYALAKICAAEKIEFGCLKFISDGADGKAAMQWEKALEQGAQLLRRAFDQIRK